MAKSLRSKRKRKMRAIKRIRYGEKELQRLKEMVAKTEEKEAKESTVLHKLQTKFTVTSMDTDNQTSDESKAKVSKALGAAVMETDVLEASAHKKKTMLNAKGQYPEWMNSRRLKKQKAVVKRLKNKKKK